VQDLSPTLSPPAPSPADGARPPEPRAWALTFVRAVGETLAQRRPPGALAGFISPEVREVLRRPPLPGPRGLPHGPRTLAARRVHLRRMAVDVVEANAVLLGPGETRAIAFRMEARRGRWICTALEIG
jgi:hypothetical protein